MSAKVPPLCYIHVTKPIGLLSYLLQSCDSSNRIPVCRLAFFDFFEGQASDFSNQYPGKFLFFHGAGILQTLLSLAFCDAFSNAFRKWMSRSFVNSWPKSRLNPHFIEKFPQEGTYTTRRSSFFHRNLTF